jgi:hypothetical protein
MRGVRKFSDGTVRNETYLASLARSHTDAAISTLLGIMTVRSAVIKTAFGRVRS